jgi:hypothetical protein
MPVKISFLFNEEFWHDICESLISLFQMWLFTPSCPHGAFLQAHDGAAGPQNR